MDNFSFYYATVDIVNMVVLGTSVCGRILLSLNVRSPDICVVRISPDICYFW
jgi:hypothetical protein